MFSAKNCCGIMTLTSNSKNNNNEGDKIESNLYEEAIKMLNKLQIKAKVLDKLNQREIEKIIFTNAEKEQSSKLRNTIKYLNRSGISLDNLDKLSVIHIAGTKGKGSTCALTKSILQSFDLKTGFYSSPHLISVTERIQINGRPITEEKFVQYFWIVYNKLFKQKENDYDMPGYFQFLTVLSFYIFLDEKVDVAIIEVGIGGENDCTNILRNTKTIGITSLGLDHVKILGDTIDKIAWHKTGIIKDKSNVFTVTQAEEGMVVINERAKERNSKLFTVPDFSIYRWKRTPDLQIKNKVQPLNASLAIQLSYDWLRNNRQDIFNKHFPNSKCDICLDINENVIEGLEKCFWPGRCQLVEYRNWRFYLDGAHTTESINVCIDWFKESTKFSPNSKILIFNATGVRDSLILLNILGTNLKFTKAYFVPNVPYIDTTNPDVATFLKNKS